MEKKEKDYFGIFNSRDLYDDEVVNDIRNGLAECRKCDPESITFEDVVDDLWADLAFEKMNLDKDINKVIIAYATLGLWNGKCAGYKIMGSNIKNIFNFYDYDDYEWYADKFDVRCNLYHHDGTNLVLFRCVKDEATANRICNKIYSGKMNEEDFIKETSSLRPYIAKIYGWKNYRKTKKQ